MLDENIKELDFGTKARNRAFQERIDEIWRSTASWEKDLKTEANTAVETILNMKDDYQKHIEKLASSLLAEVNDIFDRFDHEQIPAESARMDEIDKDLDVFFKQTVPQTIERQSGEVRGCYY
ncbi:hypothetical protein EON65_24730 [archaeon]|nr:MAG: hypothetical protein EON65_24730 [archaeon]